MATRNNKKLAAINKENCEEHPRSNLPQNSNVPRSQENYITQICEEIERKVTKKLWKEFSRTESRILGALARLDDFLMNPLIQGHSITAPETSRNAFRTSQGTNEDDSQSDPHPEAGVFNNQTTQDSGPKDGHDTDCFKNFDDFLFISISERKNSSLLVLFYSSIVEPDGADHDPAVCLVFAPAAMKADILRQRTFLRNAWFFSQPKNFQEKSSKFTSGFSQQWG